MFFLEVFLKSDFLSVESFHWLISIRLWLKHLDKLLYCNVIFHFVPVGSTLTKDMFFSEVKILLWCESQRLLIIAIILHNGIVYKKPKT